MHSSIEDNTITAHQLIGRLCTVAREVAVETRELHLCASVGVQLFYLTRDNSQVKDDGTFLIELPVSFGQPATHLRSKIDDNPRPMVHLSDHAELVSNADRYQFLRESHNLDTAIEKSRGTIKGLLDLEKPLDIDRAKAEVEHLKVAGSSLGSGFIPDDSKRLPGRP
jgi:hypothetical protein